MKWRSRRQPHAVRKGKVLPHSHTRSHTHKRAKRAYFLTYTHTHARTHAHTHTRPHIHTYIHTFFRKRIFQLRELRNIENHLNFGAEIFHRFKYGSVQQKRATERARCLFRVKGALFNNHFSQSISCSFQNKLHHWKVQLLSFKTLSWRSWRNKSFKSNKMKKTAPRVRASPSRPCVRHV